MTLAQTRPDAVAEPPTNGSDRPSVEALAQAVDVAVAKVQALDDAARGPAEELARAIEAAHRAGLVAIVRRLRDDPAGKALLFELVDDPSVRFLLSLHGIIRTEPAANGAPAAPPARTRPLIPLRPINVGGSDVDRTEGWVKTKPVADLPNGALTAMRLVARDGAEVDVVVLNTGGRLSAFRDECPHQGLPLAGALIDPAGETLTCPWHGYCFDTRSGACLSAPGAELDQLPLRVEAGDVWIRITE